jgi:ABC-type Fe3+-hydroxamate transport system substrate-binding protein
MIIKDQFYQKLEIKIRPKRIISLVPSQTELLVDLGLESFIVGITKFCVHPKHLRMSKKVIGGTKQINLDKIKALQPNIILCNKEENTKEIIEVLDGVAPIHISDIYNLNDCYELIKMYGALFKVESDALRLISNIKDERAQFKSKVQPTNLRVAYFIWKKPWMVAASNTFIDCMIAEAGFINAFKNEERYPEISLSSSILKEVDIIFLSSEPFPFKEKHIEELKKQFPNKTIKIVDGELFSWYGSRLLKSFEYFQSLNQ